MDGSEIRGRIERLVAKRVAAGATDEEAGRAGAELLGSLGMPLPGELKTLAIEIYSDRARQFREGSDRPPASTTTVA
jgi:hypothetical protein